jgi:subtilisin family serine protease
MFRINQQLSISLLLIVFFCNAYAQQNSYREGEILVRFAKDINNKSLSITRRNSILTSSSAGQVKRTLKSMPDLSLVELPAGLSVEDAINTLKGKSGIVHAQPNFIYKALSFPNDTRFNEQWALNNTGQTGGTPGADIDASKAWDIITDSNIIVAVIDTGVKYYHEDLEDNMWINQEEYNGTTGVDDDNNGYIDDIYGYDFCTIDDGVTDPDPDDDHIYGHGTHVAGIIGAVGNNGLGVTGVCWNVKIMALKFINSQGEGDTEDAVDCIGYAIQMGAKVMNNSWGNYEYDQELKDKIETANANGVIFVAAAGNSGSNNDVSHLYPASFDCTNIISVMATDDDDNRAIWLDLESSNYGPTTVDLAAPGSDILTCNSVNSYDWFSKTSAAAPHVAGACALVWAENPQLTHLEVKDYILQGAEKLDSLNGLCVTGGRLNLWRAVKGLSDFPSLTLTKNVVDANCVSPFEPLIGNYLNYEISYDANGDSDTNVVIVDYLPKELDEPNFISDAGEYDPDTNSVTWTIPELNGDDSGTYRIQVGVNRWAKPGGVITNRLWMQGDNYLKEYILDTDVCP